MCLALEKCPLRKVKVLKHLLLHLITHGQWTYFYISIVVRFECISVKLVMGLDRMQERLSIGLKKFLLRS